MDTPTGDAPTDRPAGMWQFLDSTWVANSGGNMGRQFSTDDDDADDEPESIERLRADRDAWKQIADERWQIINRLDPTYFRQGS